VIIRQAAVYHDQTFVSSWHEEMGHRKSSGAGGRKKKQAKTTLLLVNFVSSQNNKDPNYPVPRQNLRHNQTVVFLRGEPPCYK
jgi:hypothetical protein